jgi:uncharacterized protein (TIGR02147 family)
MGRESVDRLRDEYVRRKAKNHRYSLRAFAKYLSIPSGPLSEILAGKRQFTLKLAQRARAALELTDAEAAKWFAQVERENAVSAAERYLTTVRGQGEEYAALAEDQFSLVSEWYHFALLALLETKGCKPKPAFLARRLALPTSLVSRALQRLVRLGFLVEKAGTFSPTPNLTTTHDVPSAALRKYHSQNLMRAITVLEECPVEARDVTAITMAIDPAKLPLAKKAIKNFRREMANLLEAGPKTEVYNLSVVLFPLTRKGAP